MGIERNMVEQTRCDTTDEVYVGGAVPHEKEPHDRLYDSIEGLDQVINSLFWLKQRILGEEEKHHETPERPTPSLKQVLMNGSGEINDRATQMVNLIEEINGLLFTDRDEPPKF